MANLKDLKDRIGSIKNTQQITKAVKMIAANKLRQAQQSLAQLKYYKNQIINIKNDLGTNTQTKNKSNALLAKKSQLLIVISSNRGLAGAFNNNVVREALNIIQQSKTQKICIDIITIGTKARDFLKKLNIEIHKDYSYILDNIEFYSCKTEFQQFINIEKYSEITVIYNKFKNAALQIVDTKKIYTSQTNSTNKGLVDENDYILEPSKKDILINLDKAIIYILLYYTLINSFTSEQAARMITMDQASENANILLKDLTLTYNQIRQAIITNEILEISAAAKALNT